MNEIKIFESAEFGQIRTVQLNNETYFVGKDVAKALGYKNSTVALQDNVDAEDKGVTKVSTSGGSQEAIVINESGIYALVFGSKLESAKRFKHWVTSEVLPSIRNHGAYMTPETIEKTLSDPDFIIRLATELKSERAERERLEVKAKADAPKVLFADAVAVSHTSILIGDLAKLLKQNGVETGQKRLFVWLRENGYLIKRNGTDWNMPTQRSMEMGLFEVKESTINNPDGSVRINRTTKVTGKGQQYFINKFLGAA